MRKPFSYKHPLINDQVLFKKKDGGGCLEINNLHMLIPCSTFIMHESEIRVTRKASES